MPALSTTQFLRRLTVGKPVPGVLLLGGDLYLRELCRAKLTEAYVPEGARDWGVSRFSAAEDSLDRILGQAQTLPMLSPRQVIFVEDCEALEGLNDRARDAAADWLAAYFDDPAPFTVLVLEASKLDERMKLFKTLSKQTLVVAVELAEEPEERIAAAAMMTLQMARDMGLQLADGAAEELADLWNGDLTGIRTELTKLGTYAGERRKITRTDVEELVVSSKKYSVWQFAEILADRRRLQALELLDSLLREGEKPAGIVGAMAWMYRKLIEAQEAPAHLSGWQAARHLEMHSRAAELALRQSRKFARSQLLAGLTALYEADNRLKSGPANPRAVMEFLLAWLAGASVPSSHPR